jgi:hypothetical protein
VAEGREATYRWTALPGDAWTPEAAAELVGQHGTYLGEQATVTAARYVDQQVIEVTVSLPAGETTASDRSAEPR